MSQIFSKEKQWPVRLGALRTSRRHTHPEQVSLIGIINKKVFQVTKGLICWLRFRVWPLEGGSWEAGRTLHPQRPRPLFFDRVVTLLTHGHSFKPWPLFRPLVTLLAGRLSASGVT